MNCEYYYISGTINIDLLVWAKKTFPTEITNTLDAVLMRCRLKRKIDLPYIPNETFFKKHNDLRCMFIFVNAIKFKDNIEMLKHLAEQLSKLCDFISYERCLSAFLKIHSDFYQDL